MCYTPAVSLTTALIEWFLAALILIYYRKSILSTFGAALLFLLGSYQFSEFMLCWTNKAELWGTIAFLSYTFLPALGLHMAEKYLKKKTHFVLQYGLPVVFSVTAIAYNPFILQGTCETIFVTILTYFSQNLPWLLYATYYFGFILAAFLLVAHAYKQEKGSRKKACGAILAAIALMFIPTFILIGVFPALRIRFPSVLCHFALLTAAALFMAVYYDSTR